MLGVIVKYAAALIESECVLFISDINFRRFIQVLSMWLVATAGMVAARRTMRAVENRIVSSVDKKRFLCT